MKNLLRKTASFAAVLAMSLLAASSVSAAEYIPATPVHLWWAQYPTGVTAAQARSIAVADGRVYIVQPGTPGTIYYTATKMADKAQSYATTGKASANTWSSFSSLSGYSTGYGIAGDNYGNFVVAQANNAGVIVYPKGATTGSAGKAITYYAGTIEGTANFMAVTGNLLSTASKRADMGGGFVHLMCDGKNLLHRSQIYNNRSSYSDGPFQVTLPAECKANTGAYVKPCHDDKTQVLIHTGGTNSKTYHYSLTYTEDGATATKVREIGCNLMSAVIVGSGEKRFYVYASQNHSGWGYDNIKVTVQSVNNLSNKTEFTIRNGAINTQAAGMVGTWVDAEYNAAGDAIYLYLAAPGVGIWGYQIPIEQAAQPCSNLSATFSVHRDAELENQVDATFTWTTSYTNKMKFQYHSGEGEETTDWTNIRIFEPGVSSFVYPDIVKSGEYRIVTYDVVDENDTNLDRLYEGPNARMQVNVPFLPVVPKWDGDINAPGGYSLVHLNWDAPYGPTPNGYDIYRDDMLIARNHPVSNYIDTDVEQGMHTYYIQSRYLDESGDVHSFTRPNLAPSSRRAVSSADPVNDTGVERAVEVSQADPGLNRYTIDEVYNVRIGDEFDNNPVSPAMTSAWVYRQGEYRDGYWYVYQWSNSPVLTGGTKGGIIRYDASKTNPAEFAASATCVYESDEFNAGIGLALDDAGNCFINKLTRFGETKERYNSYMLPMLKGLILRPKTDGTGRFEIAKEVDFESYFAAHGITPFGQRTIYYQMTGDVLSAEGGYLYLSEFDSNVMYRVHFVNGEIAEWVKYDHTTGADHAAPTRHTETYAMPIRGTNKVIHSIRGGGYYGVDLSNPSAITSTMMIDAKSQVNSVGVGYYWYNNRLFVITPNDEFNHSTGNFLVSVAGSQDDGYGVWSDDPANSNLDATNVVPVATFTQTDLSNLVISNNAAGWFYCEPLADDDEGNGFYIYQYVPGIRFAKYRISFDYSLDSKMPAFNMAMCYDVDEDENPIDIKGINGVATWSTVKNIGQLNTNSNSYRTVLCYQIDVKDADNNTIETAYIDAAGNPADASILTSATAEHWAAPSTAPTLSHTITGLDESAFSANLTVHYINQNTGVIEASETKAETLYPEYEAAEVTNPSIRVVYRPFNDYYGNPKMLYRLDIDFLRPVFVIDEQPVSYYQVEYKRTPSSEWEVLDQLGIVRASAPANAPAKAPSADDQDEYLGESRIPGTYDFENDRGMINLDNLDNEPAVAIQFVISDCDANGVPLDDPTEWTYRIVARYAADSEVRDGLNSIAKNADASVEAVSLGQVITGVDNVAAPNGFMVYPVPARTNVTVAGVDPIRSIELFTMSGSKVMSIKGDGQNVMNINVHQLPVGQYMLRVNGGKVTRVAKI